MAALFGGAASSLNAPSAAAAPTPTRTATEPNAPQPAADLNGLISQAAKDLDDYQRLTAEGKLGEAGQKLEELKRTLEKFNAHQK